MPDTPSTTTVQSPPSRPGLSIHALAVGHGFAGDRAFSRARHAPWRRRLLWVVAAVTLLGVAAYAWVAGSLWRRQESLLFHGDPLPASYAFTLPPDAHEAFIDVPGARLDALRLQLPHPKGVVFFLHGNGGNLASWFVDLDFYRQANYDLYMLDYRGFGKSSGHIESEAQMHDDVRAAWQQVAAQYGGVKQVFYGRSLGTGLVAALAAEVQPSLTILVSPYESMEAMVVERYPYLPMSLLRYPLRTDQAVARIPGPVLLVHGERDTMIPIRHSEDLLAKAAQGRLLRLPLAGHNDVHEFPAYLAAMRDALQQL